MESDETNTWPFHIEVTSTFTGTTWQTLNEDPYNVRAETLALEHCKQGFDVMEEMTETDLLRFSCGSMIPGTPDGGFLCVDHEDPDEHPEGLLCLVQVVRVPLLPEMDAEEAVDILYDTVLTKIVKSQAWMTHTGTLPHDFIIFCWLPPVGAYEVCLEVIEESKSLLWIEALLWNVRSGGWPFSLEVRVPDEPGGIFPTHFGSTTAGKKKDYFSSLCYHLDLKHFEEADEEELWAWHIFDEDLDEAEEGDAFVEGSKQDTDANSRKLIYWAIYYLEHAQQHAEANLGMGLASLLTKSDTVYDSEAQLQHGSAEPPFMDAMQVPRTRSQELGSGEHDEVIGLAWCRAKMPGGIPIVEGRPWRREGIGSDWAAEFGWDVNHTCQCELGPSGRHSYRQLYGDCWSMLGQQVMVWRRGCLKPEPVEAGAPVEGHGWDCNRESRLLLPREISERPRSTGMRVGALAAPSSCVVRPAWLPSHRCSPRQTCTRRSKRVLLSGVRLSKDC